MVKTETCSVKLFSEIDNTILEQKLNEFLKRLAGNNYVLDIKYVANALNDQVVYSAMVLYIDNIRK